jgi:hypothetical protein
VFPCSRTCRAVTSAKAGYAISRIVPNVSQRDALNLFLDRGLNYEIDFRFQTLDELEIRLNEILNPHTDDVTEDLETALRRETAALRKNDRKTQLAGFVNNIRQLQQSYQMFYSQIGQKLANQTFLMGWKEMETGIHEKTDQGDLIGRAVCWLMVQNHPQHAIQVQHIFVATGIECTIYRQFIGEPPHQYPQTSSKPIEPPSVVCRYHGDSQPIAATLIADMQKGITKAITLLSRIVQGGN